MYEEAEDISSDGEVGWLPVPPAREAGRICVVVFECGGSFVFYVK